MRRQELDWREALNAEVARGDDKGPEDRDFVTAVDSRGRVECQEVGSDQAVRPLVVPMAVPAYPNYHEHQEVDDSL
jgi:hypothetical protein